MWIARIVLPLIAKFRTLSTSDKTGLIIGGMALGDTILTKIIGHDLKAEVLGVIVAEVAQNTGLQLDSKEPFSDASISNALSQRVGFPIRSVKDRAMLEEDIENFAVARISERVGYPLSSMRDQAKLRADFQRIGLAMVTEHIGIPLGVIDDGPIDPIEIQNRIREWARAEILTEMSSRVGVQIADFMELGDFESLAAELNGRLIEIGSSKEVDPRTIALAMARDMAIEAVVGFQKTAEKMTKRSRKQELNRIYQQRFRERHGNRQKYVPLGWGVAFDPPPE